MNRDIIAGNWKQLKGQMKAKWGDLTDDVFDEAEGNWTDQISVDTQSLRCA